MNRTEDTVKTEDFQLSKLSKFPDTQRNLETFPIYQHLLTGRWSRSFSWWCISVSWWDTIVDDHCFVVTHIFPPVGVSPNNWWLERESIPVFNLFSCCYSPFFMLKLNSELGTMWKGLGYMQYQIFKNPVTLLGKTFKREWLGRERHVLMLSYLWSISTEPSWG